MAEFLAILTLVFGTVGIFAFGNIGGMHTTDSGDRKSLLVAVVCAIVVFLLIQVGDSLPSGIKSVI